MSVITAPAPAPTDRPLSRMDSLLRARELGIALAIIIVFGLTTLNNHSFAQVASVQQLLSGAALIALLAVGETLVIVTRNVDLSVGSVVGLSAYIANVDLSVGSVVGLSAYIVGDLFKHHQGMPVLL